MTGPAGHDPASRRSFRRGRNRHLTSTSRLGNVRLLPSLSSMTNGSHVRILVVEDEADIAQLIKHTLERSGDARVDIVESGDAAVKAVQTSPPDLMILDLN